jgi:hypothetical protein
MRQLRLHSDIAPRNHLHKNSLKKSEPKGRIDVAKTQDILDRCTGLANTRFPETGAACTAREAAIYLAHTEQGESLRALADATGTHPSTVMRTVRRVEARRDDPLVDSMLTDLEGSAGELDGTAAPAAADPANQNEAPGDTAPGLPRAELEREARRFLRRLSEPGSFLLVTPDATKGGIFCKANEHRKPIAMLPVRVAVEFVREGWIRVFQRGAASIRYRISDDGRSYLKRLLAEDAIKRQPASGFAEAATPFLAQHQIPGERAVTDPLTGERQALKVNLGEDPLGWLARRKGPDGQPFLSPDEIEAGERLRLDFEMAQLGPSVAQDWRKFLTPGDRLSGSSVPRGPGEGPMAARDRVAKALSGLGPGLSDAALRVCCFLEGLEACERRMGWSARSGKVVLKIALQRLAEHYGLMTIRH